MSSRMRSGFTIMEVMIAVSIASFIAAIGFTGVNAFGKAVTRSKQFTAESQIIVATLRYAVRTADVNGGNQIAASGTLPIPKNWPAAEVSGNTLTFTVTVKDAQVGGAISSGLQTDSNRKNSLLIKALMTYQ